ncbi:hypothetical protein [Microcoleus phage My-WqHQDG]|nr:hypothetical protein [Microcoleus phage My-WqHQDG]
MNEQHEALGEGRALPSVQVDMEVGSPSASERELIVLVGCNHTGKHTYLKQYYQRLGLDQYMHLSYGFIEQRGMHPCEQRAHMDRVKRLDYPGLPNPYMFVTYSPYIVDELHSTEVICFHKSKGGRYYRGSLQLHPDIEWGMQTLTVGEFWDAVGEDWLEEYGEDVTQL